MFLFFLLPISVQAKEKVPVYIFKNVACPHCANAMAFFEKLESQYGSYYELVAYETSDSPENRELMTKVATTLGNGSTAVPFIVIGKESFIGYSTSKDVAIKKAIMEEYGRNNRYNVMDHLYDKKEDPEEKPPEGPISNESKENSTQQENEKKSFWQEIIWIVLGILAVITFSVILVIQKKRYYHE